MRLTQIAAITLILIGGLTLVRPVISYTTREKVADLGPIEVTTTKEHTVPILPILGGAAAVAGVMLLLAGRRRTGA